MILTPTLCQPHVPRRGLAPVLLVDIPDGVTIPVEPRPRVVGGAVIDNDDLQLARGKV